MAQLTVDAGVTVHDPVQVVEGDTRTSGWAGGQVYQRTAEARLVLTDPYSGYWVSVLGARAIGAGTSFARTANALSVTTDPYGGFLTGVASPLRSAAPTVTASRTTIGITKLDPVAVTFVQPPPTVFALGSANARIQRQQRWGTQAVFFKDQGGTNHRTPTARWGASQILDARGAAAVRVRPATAGLDLASLAAAGFGPAPRARLDRSGADLLVVRDAAARAGRTWAGRGGVDLLTLTDFGGFGGRSGTGGGADIFAQPWESNWINEVPYVWLGGTVYLTLLAPYLSATVFEVGYEVVAPGTNMHSAGNPGPIKYAYVGWYSETLREAGTGGQFMDGTPGGPYYWGIDTAGGSTVHSSDGGSPSPVQSFAAGDLYTYAYGNLYNSLNPAEVKPTQLPDPPSPLVAHSPIPAGPRPVVTYAAESRQPPANDKLRSYLELTGLSGNTTFTDIAATLEPLEPALGIGAQASRGTVWFSWAPGYDGEITLTAPGTALEVYSGPGLYTGPVVGVDGYRGAYDPAAAYAAGDMVAFNGAFYRTTAAVSGKAPDAPDIVGGAVMAAGAISTTAPDLPLGFRVTLQPGTYYFIGDGGGGGYSSSNPSAINGATSPSEGTSRYGTTTWGNSSDLFYPFVLFDSVTQQEVAGYRPMEGGGFGRGYHQYSQFTLLQAVTFDTLRLNASDYDPAPTDTYGIAVGVGTGFSSITWAQGASDLNPWVVAPDSNPLTYAHLMPMGAGSGAVTTGARAAERYYIRAYPLTEAAANVPLGWTTHVAALLVTVPQAYVPAAPANLSLTVSNATPGATVEFRIDSSASAALVTGVVGADGFLQVSLPIGASVGAGAHLVLVTETATGRTGNQAFTVGETIYTPPDAVDPPVPLVLPVPPTPVPRWHFQDPTDQTVWSFTINPRTVDSPVLARTLTPHHTTAAGQGQPIVFEGGRLARRWSFAGTTFSLAELDQIASWKRPYRVYLTDDLGRTYVVKVLGLQSQPKRDPSRPEHHTYVVSCLLYGRVGT